MNRYLKETVLLDYNHPAIQKLIEDQGWHNLAPQQRILAAYNFVRDEIKFGFNQDDAITASQVLSDGYGQCNTKSSLFMALLRALNIPCRLHGFTIDKDLQAGIMQGELFDMLPREIVHTWTELWFNDRWYNMEGLILDLPYLAGLQKKFADVEGKFSGYGAATTDLHHPQVYWDGTNDTYIQKEGIVQDFGLFDDPDSFFSKHTQALDCEKRKLFADVLRHKINQSIAQIRQ